MLLEYCIWETLAHILSPYFLHWFFYVTLTCRVVHVVVYSCLIMCNNEIIIILLFMHACCSIIINYDDAKIKKTPKKKIMKQLMKERPEIKVPNQIAEALTHMGNNLRSSTC